MIDASFNRTTTIGEEDDQRCGNLFRFVVNSLVAGAICLFGFVGNNVSHVVLGRDQEILPVTRLLLRSLAVADNTFLLLWFVHFSVHDLISFTGVERVIGSVVWLYVRLVTYPVLFIGQTATIWLTVLIAATRYVIVCHPTLGTVHCSLSATRKGVVAVVVLSITYNVPRYLETRLMVTTDKDDFLKYYLDRTELGANWLYNFLYQDSLYYVFSFVLPLLLLSLFNVQLIISYRSFRRKRLVLRTRAGSEDDSSEQNVTLIMITVILVFMLCNAPAKMVQILLTYRVQRCMTAEFFLREVSTVLEVLSSSVNFIIYCVRLKRFQAQLLCVDRRVGARASEEIHMMVTASTYSGKIEDGAVSV